MTNSWHILGVGAIGSLFATSLARAGISTTLLGRSADKHMQLGHGSTNICIERNGTRETISFATSHIKEPNAIHHLLVTTKAYDVRAAVSQLKHRLNPNSHIVVLVNGMGFMSTLQSDFPNYQFACGTTTAGAYRPDGNETNCVCHAGNGVTRFGRTRLVQPPTWFDDWSSIDLPCSWEHNIEECLWQKLAVNCAINPLSALHRCHNGALSTQAELAVLVKQLCDEIALVSAAAGFRDAASNIHRWVSEVIQGTGDNRSSMLQDTLAGRRTENDYITGYLLKVARQYGVPVPANEAAHKGILRLEKITR